MSKTRRGGEEKKQQKKQKKNKHKNLVVSVEYQEATF